jgi:hypothetical protein
VTRLHTFSQIGGKIYYRYGDIEALLKQYYNRALCQNMVEGLLKLPKQFFKVKDSIDYPKLYQYTKQFQRQAIIKRLGYLLELLEIENEIVFLLLADRTIFFVQLDPSLTKGGKCLAAEYPEKHQ